MTKIPWRFHIGGPQFDKIRTGIPNQLFLEIISRVLIFAYHHHDLIKVTLRLLKSEKF